MCKWSSGEPSSLRTLGISPQASVPHWIRAVPGDNKSLALPRQLCWDWASSRGARESRQAEKQRNTGHCLRWGAVSVYKPVFPRSCRWTQGGPRACGAGRSWCVLRSQPSHAGSETKSRAGFWDLICYVGPRSIINTLHEWSILGETTLGFL